MGTARARTFRHRRALVAVTALALSVGVAASAGTAGAAQARPDARARQDQRTVVLVTGERVLLGADAAGRTLLREGDRNWAHATAGLGMVAQDEGRVDDAVGLQRLAIAEFTRICGGRPLTAARSTAIEISGDTEVGDRVVEHLNYVM